MKPKLVLLRQVNELMLLEMVDTEQLVFWAYGMIILSTLIGLVLHFKVLWPHRVLLSTLLTFLVGASTGLLIVSGSGLWILITIIVLQTYRLFGILRLAKKRHNETRLRVKSLKTEVFFGTLVLLTIIFSQLELNAVLIPSEWVFVLASIQVVFALIYWNHLRDFAKLSNLSPPEQKMTDTELPSLTVAIPARNETEELAGCLTSILDSNYPKLEIIVVDDCSQDNTSEIIKNFAHRGVRFIHGTSPPKNWLAKNFAYSQLLDEASGKFVIFCGTDVRLGVDTLRQLIELMNRGQLDMLSIMPVRFIQPFDKHFLLQPMRYWREIVVPRLLDKSPPVLSTFWAVKRSKLINLGGFGAFKQSIRPEKYFARAIGLNNYRLVRATSGYKIESVKNSAAQWNTAIRTRYPELRNQPEKVFISTLNLVFILLLPIVIFIVSVNDGLFLSAVLSFCSVLILSIIYLSVHALTNPKVHLARVLLLPVSIVLEVIVNNYSMWAYEFSEVNWKGRNICIPVLQSINSLKSK